MPTLPKKAIVVGAGLSGLSAAYHLVKAGWHVSVLEASDAVGGRVQSEYKQGYIIDTGASAMATSYTAYLKVAEELGLKNKVVDVSPYVGIYRDGTIHEMNMEKMLSSGIKSKLLSWSAKLRMIKLVVAVLRAKKQIDYNDMSKAAPLDNESVRSYALRELGEELNDYLCDPLTRIMLIADGDKISKVELFSAIVNIFGTRMQALQGGVNVFAQALAKDLDVNLGCEATHVKDLGHQVEVSWKTREGSVQSQQVDACVVACQLPVAKSICPDYQAVLAPLAEKLTYTAAITVAIATTIKPDSNAFVIPMPACESVHIALLFLEHNKSADRTPDNRYMINAHWETEASTDYLNASDEEIVAKSLETVLKVFPELAGSVEMTHVARWPRALPKTEPGVYQAIGDFNRAIDPKARVQFAADYMSAAGQNTAVEFGARAANNLIKNI